MKLLLENGEGIKVPIHPTKSPKYEGLGYRKGENRVHHDTCLNKLVQRKRKKYCYMEPNQIGG